MSPAEVSREKTSKPTGRDSSEIRVLLYDVLRNERRAADERGVKVEMRSGRSGPKPKLYWMGWSPVRLEAPRSLVKAITASRDRWSTRKSG